MEFGRGGSEKMIWEMLKNGEVHTNHGWFHPETRPFGYWLSVVMSFGLYLVFVGALFFPLASKAVGH
jgi:hypothetical protein